MVYGMSKAGKSVDQIVETRCKDETLGCQAIGLYIKQFKPLINKW